MSLKYKYIWKLNCSLCYINDQVSCYFNFTCLLCDLNNEKDTRAEVEEQHENAIGFYKPPTGTKQPNSKTLAGHVSIELSRLLNNFLETLKTNCSRKSLEKEKRETGRHHGTAHSRSLRERTK